MKGMAYIITFFVGAIVGMGITCLCVIAGDRNDE